MTGPVITVGDFDGTPEDFLYCHGCSLAGGADMGVFHTKKARKGERGYRVAAYELVLGADDKVGETFATPDMAVSTARKRAKAERRAYIIVRDGVDWKMVYGDGHEQLIEATQP